VNGASTLGCPCFKLDTSTLKLPGFLLTFDHTSGTMEELWDKSRNVPPVTAALSERRLAVVA
jgi:hypothetical protein